MMIFNRNKTFMKHILIPIIIITWFFWFLPNTFIKSFDSIMLSKPASIYNGTTVGDFNLGLPMHEFVDLLPI
jgi:hypothetical protein